MAELIKNRESLAEVRAKLNAANSAFSSRAAFEAASIPTGVDLIYVIDTPEGGDPGESSVFQLMRSELGDWVAGDGSIWKLSFGSDALQEVIEAAQAAEEQAEAAAAAALAAGEAAAAAEEAAEAAQAAENSLLKWAGAWVTATAYQPSDIVFEGTSGSSYVCVVAHTSGTFSTDLAANRWALFAQRGSTGSGSGDMNNSDNLAGLTDKAVARSNLQLEALATLPVSGTMDASTVLHGDGVFRSALPPHVTLYDTAGVHEWTKPEGYPSTARVVIEGIGGGGGGGRASSGVTGAGGGGGGGYFRVEFGLGELPGTLNCEVGAGGAGGAANNTPGSWGSPSLVTGLVGEDTVEFFRARAGAPGQNSITPGEGGGGSDNFWSGGRGGQGYKPQTTSPNGNITYPAVNAVPPAGSTFGGGGGGSNSTNSNAHIGGVSQMAGDGGNANANGAAPGGGGGAAAINTSAGAGARGMIRITVSP